MKKMVKSLIAAIGVALMMTGSAFAADVAKIGDTNYTTLADAVAALKANGGTLKLLADVNESITFNSPAEDAPTEITVDLNGFTVTSAESTLWVSDGYVVTVKDSSDAKTGKIISTNTEGEAIAINRNGHVILESGYIYNDFCAVWLYKDTENGSFVMNGGTLEVPNGGQTLSVGAGKATINGGKVLCNKTPITGGGWNTYVYQNGTLVITGGEFLGTIGNYGKTAISGGTFSYPDDPNDGFREAHLASGYATKVNADGSITVYELPTSLQGTGTAEDPFLINNIDDLKLFRNLVNSGTRYNGQYVKLTADIDLNDEEWTPIGDRNVDQGSFLGTFDGDNHTISNLWISEWTKTGAGFFSKVGLQTEYVSGTVRNLTFNNVTIVSSESYVGVIAQAPSGALIENVHVTGDITISGYGYVGGIVGHGYPTINNSSVVGNTGSTITANYWGAGAILGFSGDYGAKISNATVEGVKIHANSGGAASVTGSPYGAALDGASVKNVEITSNSDYCMGYVSAGGNLSNVTIENVTATANGQPITPADAKASIGDTVYFSLSSAISALKDGDTVTLLGNCELVSGIDIDKNITVDGAGYKVYAANNANKTEMFNIRSKVTITNLTFDANHKFSYGIQVQDAADVTLSDVSILYAGYNNWGAAVNLNGGKLFVSGNFTAFSGGENGGAFPFTGILYWGGDFKFADGVTASIADPTGATADSDLLLVGTVGLLSIEDADAFLSQFNIPSGFAPYTLALDADIVSSFGGFTGASPLPWNTIIDYGKQILEAIGESTTETQVTVGLLDDTVIPDVFVYEDANFSINGNGKTLTGTIDVTDNVGTISNVVLTSDTTFVMTNVTTGCVKFGDNVTISSPVTIVPPANYGVGSAPLIEFTDGSGVKPEDFVIDQSAVEIPEGTEFVVDGNKIVLGTPVAKIGEVKYASLLGAIAAAKSGDTVTLLGDCGITTGIILDKNITIDGGNFTLTAESGDGSLAQMVRVDSAATIKNITLAVNHKYDYGIQMNNPASDLTLENVTILYAGKAEGHKNGELLFGASVFLQQGNLLVKGKFTAFSGGETAGTFPFTGILYWPAGDTAPTFRFDTGATASISDPTGATSDSDLLLVGAPGILSVDEADAMLSAFNIPAGFAPYTLKLDCPIVQSVGGGFTGASPLAWNTIIDYGKKILTVVNQSTTETQVEVGILDDVEIPEVFVYEDANFSINGNGKELKGTIDFTDNVGTIKNVELTSDMTFVMTNVTEGCVKLGEGVIITEPVKVIPPDNFGRGEDSATLIEFAEGSGLSLEDFEIDTSTVQLPEGSQIVQDGNKIIVKLPIAQVGNRKFATLAEAFEAANDGDTVRVLYSFNTNETIVINKAVTFDFSGDVITNTVSGAAIQVAAEGVKFIGGELVAKGNGIEVANGGSSVIERGVYEVTGDALAGSVTVSGGTFNKLANVINHFKSDDCEAVDNGDGWCTVMDYVAQFGEAKYVFLQDAIDAAAASAENPATVTLLGNVAGSVTLPENVIINANGYTVQSVVDSVGHIVELHGGAYQVGKYPEPPPIRSIKVVGDKVQLSFVPRKVLAWVRVLSTTDLSATTWTSEEVDVTGAAVGKEFTATVDKPDGNSAFFKIEFAYSE